MALTSSLHAYEIDPAAVHPGDHVWNGTRPTLVVRQRVERYTGGLIKSWLWTDDGQCNHYGSDDHVTIVVGV